MHLHKQFDRAGAGRHQLLAHRPKVVPHLLEWCTAAHLESQLIAIGGSNFDLQSVAVGHSAKGFQAGSQAQGAVGLNCRERGKGCPLW